MTCYGEVMIACVISAIGAEPDYRFVEDTSGYVMMQQGDFQHIGKLNKSGAFVYDPRLAGLKKGSLLSGIPPFRPLNYRGPGKERVYEFRSGCLILGELDKDGNFVPDIGSKVINFKDYRYREDGIKIYNLPGRFERVEMPKK